MKLITKYLKIKKIIYILLILFIKPILVFSQEAADETENERRFKAALTLGINASQLDGDDLGGYNKLGIAAGIRTSVTFAESPWALLVEVLASQKGSKMPSRQAAQLGNDETFCLHLTFVEIPVLLQYNFDKIALEGGGYYARLLAASTQSSPLTSADFKKNDAGALVGVNYSFNENWNVGLRYSRSLVDIVNHKNLNTNSLYGHLFNIQISYQF